MMPNLPPEFVQRIRLQFGKRSEALLQSYQEQPAVSIRLNPIKASHEFELDNSIEWSKYGRYLNNRPNFALDPFFHAGCYYVQEASSMWIGKVVDFLSEQIHISKALDLCAAPGGKSTDLRAVLPATTTLLSNEIIRNRFNILEENLIKWGHPGVILTNRSPEQLEKIGKVFDFILVDAPCSGEGLFRKDKDAVNHWNQGNLQSCSLRQKNILRSADKLLKEDGFLLYSTCTFNPAENEEICSWALSEFGWDSMTIPFGTATPPEEVPFKDGLGYRCRPDIHKGEGFYFALFQKSSRNSVSRKTKSKLLKPIPFPNYYSHPYLPTLTDGFSPFVLMDTHIVWLSDSMKDVASVLNAVKVPFIVPPIGRIKGKSIIPEHYAAMMDQDDYPQKVELDLKQALEYLRLGWPQEIEVQNGWNLVRYEGVNLGWVKGIDGRRVNNYYPRGYRLRI